MESTKLFQRDGYKLVCYFLDGLDGFSPAEPGEEKTFGANAAPSGSGTTAGNAILLSR